VNTSDVGGAGPGSIEGVYNVYGKSEQGEAAKYARLPESVLFDHGLSATARCVYGVLARYTYQGTVVRIGQRRIARLLGLHLETVNVALRQLESRQHISIRGSGHDRRSYHLHSSVFGQKQRAGIEEVISSPSGTPRLASTRMA
jgi:DNA-binding MarR family transcriptional regulator